MADDVVDTTVSCIKKLNTFFRRQFQPHVPFDMAHCESSFPRVTDDLDDKSFSEVS